MVLDNAETQGGRPYNGNYNAAAVTEQESERISVGFNHVIAVLAAVVGILCFVLMVGSFYFRSALVRYERKLSDHIQLELRHLRVFPIDESAGLSVEPEEEFFPSIAEEDRTVSHVRQLTWSKDVEQLMRN